MKIAAIVIAGVIVLVALLMGITATVLRRVARKMQEEIDRRFFGKNILRQCPAANYLGRKSAGAAQVRGNGGLVLTDTMLWFLQFAPRREFTIPLAAITDVTMPWTFRGRAAGRPLLCVRFRNDAGDADAIAWVVRDAEAWAEAINAARPTA